MPLAFPPLVLEYPRALRLFLLDAASQPRGGQTLILWKHRRVVEVVEPLHPRHQRLAIAGHLAHRGVALQLQQPDPVAHRGGEEKVHHRAVLELVPREVHRDQLNARPESLDGGDLSQLVVHRDERGERRVVPEALQGDDLVIADVKGGQRDESRRAVEVAQAILRDVEAPQPVQVEEALEIVDGVALEVQGLQAGVLLEVCDLRDALAVQVEHVVELGGVRVAAMRARYSRGQSGRAQLWSGTREVPTSTISFWGIGCARVGSR